MILSSMNATSKWQGKRHVCTQVPRFSNFLTLRFLSRQSTSSPKFLGKVDGSRAAFHEKLLKVVSALSGYDSVEDFIVQERLCDKSTDQNCRKENFDLSLVSARFPCISVGDSSLIELYNEVKWKNNRLSLLMQESCTSHLSASAIRNWGDAAKEISADEISDASQFLMPQLPNINSSYEQCFSTLLNDSVTSHADGGVELDKLNANEYSVTEESKSANNNVCVESVLDASVKCIPQTTFRQCHQLEEGGFHTVRKLLHHFPRTYADLQTAPTEINDGDYLIFVGKVSSSRAIKISSSLSFLEIVVNVELVNDLEMCKKNINLHLKKFFRGVRFTYQPFLRSIQSKYELGAHVYITGKVKKMLHEDHYEIREYNIGVLEEDLNGQVENLLYPIYPSKAGMKPSFLKDIITRALKVLSKDIDPIPNNILQELNLPNLYDAYMGIHSPKRLSEANLARRRLNFDEFFYVQLGRLFQMLEPLGTTIEKEELLHKYKSKSLNITPMEEWSTLTRSLLNALPYSLTPSQLNAISEIIWDLRGPVPMNRLLQGDVGCGKTVVAFLACMEVIASGFQAAIMVPTELVAIQHHEHLTSLLENVDAQCRPSVVLLTGSVLSKQSKMILKGLQTGEINMVIGTHSLIADKVEFSALRIAVIDEQQRFGVIQRGRFNSKLYPSSLFQRTSNTSLAESIEDKTYMVPHVLAMSATPIPRTLALAIYGDMSLTKITDLPPGRAPVETFVFEGNDFGFENAFQVPFSLGSAFTIGKHQVHVASLSDGGVGRLLVPMPTTALMMMDDELHSGGKVYVVYPIIEESELLPDLHAASTDFESLSKKFESYSCGLLHGRMTSEEKDESLKKFKSGETRVLLSTQVIEIGIDVPDASMMVVMNAERFGTSQLHQLRGRVGRGTRRSKCIFLSSSSKALNRLKILEASSDGFNLALADLLLRGPGNLLGKKQSGHLPDFPVTRLELDGNILQEAHLAALKVLSISHDLHVFPRLRVELSMRKPLCILGD